MKTKVLIFILALSFVLSIPMTINAVEDGGTTRWGYSWNYSDGTLTITGDGEIPNNTSVNRIPWVSYKNDIETVVISSGITSIGQKVFDGHLNLKEVYFEEDSSLSTINNYAFQNCSNLTTLELPLSITSIKDNAFDGCSSLTTMLLPSSLTLVGASAFTGCTNLRTIVITSSVLDCPQSAGTLTPSGTKIIGCNGMTLTSKTNETYFNTYFGNRAIDTHIDQDCDGKCDICNADAKPFSSADMSLGTNISMNYYARIPSLDPAKVSVDFVLDGYTTSDVSGVLVDAGESKYSFTYYGISPEYMNDGITAIFKYDGIVIGGKSNYSIKDYCNRVKELSEYESNPHMQQLIADMLAYGAAAQEYTGRNVENLVNSDWDVNATTFTNVSSTDMTNTKSTNDNVKITAAGVSHDFVNTLYVRFVTDDMSKTAIKVNGNYVDINESASIAFSNEISAFDFDRVYTFELEYDGDVIQTVTYSVKSYVYSKQTGDDVNAKLTKALYNYGLSAIAFRG
ncbi:MAG: leucine-rich repeat domain-containing protein [Clostridia bacterium]|nr:leucine-rich repeat domain-containing protein [Clostridia bacterium]